MTLNPPDSRSLPVSLFAIVSCIAALLQYLLSLESLLMLQQRSDFFSAHEVKAFEAGAFLSNTHTHWYTLPVRRDCTPTDASSLTQQLKVAS
jgi:6-phosphogluconate dehydrogenase